MQMGRQKQKKTMQVQDQEPRSQEGERWYVVSLQIASRRIVPLPRVLCLFSVPYVMFFCSFSFAMFGLLCAVSRFHCVHYSPPALAKLALIIAPPVRPAPSTSQINLLQKYRKFSRVSSKESINDFPSLLQLPARAWIQFNVARKL